MDTISVVANRVKEPIASYAGIARAVDAIKVLTAEQEAEN